MSEAFRQWGSEIEVAMREAGSPLSMPGEALVRSMFDDMQRQAESPEWQARVAPLRSALQQFTEELRVELPGGVEDPAFMPEMEKRMRRWRDEHPEFGGEAST